MLNRSRHFPTGQTIARAAWRSAILASVWALATSRAVYAGWSADLLPLLAQAQKTAPPEQPAETGSWPILDWLIVGVLICAAIYAVCRSSRRN
jgi:hypothetical protein